MRHAAGVKGVLLFEWVLYDQYPDGSGHLHQCATVTNRYWALAVWAGFSWHCFWRGLSMAAYDLTRPD